MNCNNGYNQCYVVAQKTEPFATITVSKKGTISQGSVETYSMYSWIFSKDYCRFTAEYGGERILEVGQHLKKTKASFLMQWWLCATV